MYIQRRNPNEGGARYFRFSIHFFHLKDPLMEILLERQTYEPALFVDRADQVRIVDERVSRARTDESVTAPIVNFWGGSGIGKTWLLNHLGQKYQYQPPS